MKETFTLVATAAAGLEAVVGRELRELGYDTQVENGKVNFQHVPLRNSFREFLPWTGKIIFR